MLIRTIATNSYVTRFLTCVRDSDNNSKPKLGYDDLIKPGVMKTVYVFLSRIVLLNFSIPSF